MKWLILHCILFLLITGTAMAEPVKMCTDPWPPYSIGEFNQEATGLAQEMLAKIFEKVDREFVVHILPWARCLEFVKSGTYDAINHAAYKESRTEHFVFPEMAFTNSSSVWYNPEKIPNFDWNEFEDLNKYTYDLVRDYAPPKKVADMIKSGQQPVAYSTNFEVMVRKLVHQRTDFTLSNEIVMYHHLKMNNLSGRLVAHPKPFMITPYHLAVFGKTSKNIDLLPKINQAIIELKEQGYFKKMVDSVK